MELLDTTKLMKKYAKESSKFCMYISWDEDMDVDEVIKAAPYLKDHRNTLLNHSNLILIFDTVEEMDYHFDQTVGDDRPASLNIYNGVAHVYALSCSDKGELWNENT